MLYWSGLEPGSSKEYALTRRIERRLTRLLQAIAQSWTELELTHHKEAEYDEDNTQVVVLAKGAKRRDSRAITAFVWYEPDEDDAETYLMTTWYAKRRRDAKELGREATRRRELRLSGLRAPSMDERQWYMRGFPLSTVEGVPAEEQFARVKDFVRETFQAMEQSGVLETQLRNASDRE